MADSLIQVPPDSTGGKVDTTSLTVGANTVHRQRVNITGATATQIAPVDATFGLAVDVTRSAALPTGTNNIGDVDVLSLPALPAGSNNIGDVDVLTLPALPAGSNNIGDVDVLTLPALPAGANNIGDVDVLTLPAIPAGNNNIGDVDVASIAAGDNNIGNVDVVTLPALPAGTNNIGDVDVLTLPALPAGTNKIGGVDVLTLPALPAGTNNIGGVGVLTLPALPAGTNNIGDVDVLTLPGIVGNVAHASADSGAPVKIGGKGKTADPTAVTADGRTDALFDTLGKPVVLIGSLNENHLNGTATYTTTTAADVIAAQASGVKIAVTSILVTNHHATVSTKVEIRDGTTVKIQGSAAAVGGGFVLTGGGRPLFISTAATAVTARCVTTGADVDVSISGYKTTV